MGMSLASLRRFWATARWNSSRAVEPQNAFEVTVLGKGRVVRNVALQAEPAEPAVGEVQMHLLAQPALRADAAAVADKQHPDHQLRIDRGAPNRAVERLQMRTEAGQVDEAVDRAKQVVRRDMAFEAELIEQRLLHHRPLAHHRCVLLLPGRIESALQTTGNTDFFNTIRQERTFEFPPIMHEKGYG
ncbi:hypothetical protein TSO221_03245 [Azospirillum sp. TSO22-1]|nr:hypothetical protein TSO221_03245 [Azospirillum sp. TSO22-1]